jgi:hypothetical protein
MSNGVFLKAESMPKSVPRAPIASRKRNPQRDSAEGPDLQGLPPKSFVIRLDSENVSIHPSECRSDHSENHLQLKMVASKRILIERQLPLSWTSNERIQFFEFMFPVLNKLQCLDHERKPIDFDMWFASTCPKGATLDHKLQLIEIHKQMGVRLYGDNSSHIECCVDRVLKAHDVYGLSLPPKKQLRADLERLARRTRSKIEGPLQDACTVAELFPDLPYAAEIPIPFGYRLTREGVYHELTGEQVMATPMVISAIADSIAKGDQQLQLTVYGVDGPRTFLRSVLDVSCRSRVNQLSMEGVDVTDVNQMDVIAYLQCFRNEASPQLPRLISINQFGFVGQDNGDEQFSHFVVGHHVISRKANEIKIGLPPVSYKFVPNGPGQQDLANRLRQSGSLKGWFRAIKPFLQFSNARLFLLGSFAAPLLQILEKTGFTFSLAGKTGKGKTTLLKLTASPWGNPECGSGLIRSYHGTLNGLVSLAEMSRGVPMFLDETTTDQDSPDPLVEKIVYLVGNGQGKTRATISGTDTLRSIRTMLFTTGERPLMELCRNQGANRRLIEIQGPPFGTRSRKTKLALEEAISAVGKNHGVAGPRFARYLLRNQKHWPRWIREFKRFLAEELSWASQKGYSAPSLPDQLALLRLVEVLLNKCFKTNGGLFQGTVSGVREDLYRANQAGDPDLLALDALKRLAKGQPEYGPSSNFWYCVQSADFCVTREFFSSWFKRNFPQSQSTAFLRKMAELGVLQKERSSKDRLTVRRTPQGSLNKITVYAFSLPAASGLGGKSGGGGAAAKEVLNAVKSSMTHPSTSKEPALARDRKAKKSS